MDFKKVRRGNHKKVRRTKHAKQRAVTKRRKQTKRKRVEHALRAGDNQAKADRKVASRKASVPTLVQQIFGK